MCVIFHLLRQNIHKESYIISYIGAMGVILHTYSSFDEDRDIVLFVVL